MFLIVKFNLTFESNVIIGIFTTEKEFLHFKNVDKDDDHIEEDCEYYLEITESNKLVDISLKHDMYSAMGQRNKNYDTFDSWYEEHFVAKTVHGLQLDYLNDRKGE